ncbi:MAG: UDP-N-acetylglucosamine 1-carboxyvinyltransferase [Deltaproteobacteria bacterium]|nr:UDP-N-acetylglucosamine 1-carboxyvinyltransferase [Deltaproteobacteria bacterium]MBW2306296.1 UDP-N-acetylglucosamine 1-carboxyvinyltransferase [Deltaproteobacteria bacterium]
MYKMIIQGGQRLEGEIEVSGAKNATLPLMAASLMAGGCSTFTNVPRVNDVATACKLLTHLGASVERVGKDEIRIDASRITGHEAPYELVRTMRASVLVLGPLLARLGRARVSLPGGCAIGARPVDQHLKGLGALGVHIELDGGYIDARVDRMRGVRFCFDVSTVGGTETMLMAAVCAEGTTVLQNAACEPEVAELARVLNRMGARIEGIGTETLVIHGVRRLEPIRHEVIPDRIVAGTFMAAAAIAGGDVQIRKCPMDMLEAVADKMEACGIRIIRADDGVRVTREGPIRPVDIETFPYPGFPTDMQAQMMALLSVAEGTSVIREKIFENRFMHVLELQRMGADIRIRGNTAIVTGVPYLKGAPVMATDLRASASLVLAGLVARGTTVIDRVYHLDRGYERIEEKLNGLGANIQRVWED